MSSSNYKVALLDDYQHISLSLSPRLAALKSNPQISLTIFTTPIPPESLATTLQPFDVLLTMRERTRFPREIVQGLPNLKLLVTTGLRNAALDLDALEERGIPVLGCAPVRDPTTELCWTLIMAGWRNLVREDRKMRSSGKGDEEGKVKGWTEKERMGRELSGKTLGLVGFGRLGQAAAKLADVFGMKILVWSPNMTPDRFAKSTPPPSAALSPTLNHLLSNSHIVSLHLVLSESTRHIISEAEFSAMRKDALFVNTSRGGLVDTKSMVNWLRAVEDVGEGGGAALDVYEEEPLGFDDGVAFGKELRELENVVLSPHMGYVSRENMANFYEWSAENVLDWINGKAKPERVLKPVSKR